MTGGSNLMHFGGKTYQKVAALNIQMDMNGIRFHLQAHVSGFAHILVIFLFL
jgi:hypothetical protein